MYNLVELPSIASSLSRFEKDCAITVALKIVDDSCKMDTYEKSIFMALYKALPCRESDFFKQSVFDIIDLTKEAPTAHLYAEIKILREVAMERISRPKMKAFKASIREKLLS